VDCYEFEIPDVQWQMNRLGAKMPALKELEVKLDLMRELKPELKSLANDITRLTDTSDLVKARQGGKQIKKMLSAQGKQIEEEWNKRIEDVWGFSEGKTISASTTPEEVDETASTKDLVIEKVKEIVKPKEQSGKEASSEESTKEAVKAAKAEVKAEVKAEMKAEIKAEEKEAKKEVKETKKEEVSEKKETAESSSSSD